ncbi:HNH endonuclease [Chryseobacterium sp. C3]|uniref:HNH endonuclease n=1 Tax=Chryseobacterium sp. C3 TaxID=2761532 RepID=UPI0016257B18|nr:HNH endonuclease [Chryseobacterium sp. C3]
MLNILYSDTKALLYYNEIKNKIFPRIRKDGNIYIDDIEKNNLINKIGLTKEKIKEIITSKPKRLIEINSEFMNNYITNFEESEYFAYTALKENEKSYCTKYHEKILNLKRVFNYRQYVSNNYFLAELLDIHTCIYCNRNYVKTIGNTNEKTARAEYDHFFSQSKYPLLALSFYNLIPICGNCNKKKLDNNFTLKSHLHPYSFSDEEKKFTFSFRKKNFIENNVKINISTNDKASKEKIEKTFSDLHLEKIYNVHSDKELRDLLDLRYKYSKNYLDILCNKTFESLNLSQEEAYRMIFGIETNEDDYHKRPFSKFKHDIIEELKKSF